MSYGTKYIFTWENIHGSQYEIQIKQNGYTGNSVRRCLGRPPILKKESSGRIQGTSLEIYAECEVDQEFASLYTSDAREYEVVLSVYENEYYARSLWSGFVVPELYNEPDIAPPYDVQIIATDGLGELKRKDWTAYGTHSLREHLTRIVAETGLSAEVSITTNIQAVSPATSSFDTMVKFNLDYMAGSTYYEVLEYLCDSLNAYMTFNDNFFWFIRETDINTGVVYAPYLRGLKADGFWPVGQLSTVVEPAANKVILKSPWHFAEGGLHDIDMEADTVWSNEKWYPASQTADFGSLTHVAANEDRAAHYRFDGASAGSGAQWTNCNHYLKQNVVFSDFSSPMDLLLRVAAAEPNVSTFLVSLQYITNGTNYALYATTEDGDIAWRPLGANMFATALEQKVSGSANNPEDITLNIPAFGDGTTATPGILIVKLWTNHGRSTQGTTPRPSGMVSISLYHAGLSVAEYNNAGYQDTIIINNNARESKDEVEVFFGKASASQQNFVSLGFLKGIALINSTVVTSWTDFHNTGSQLSFLSLMARDYALCCAAPRLRTKGKVNVPTDAMPLCFMVGPTATAYKAWVETFSFDLVNAEADIELLSLPSVALSVTSETIKYIPQGSTSVSSAGSSSGGGGGGGSTPVIRSYEDLTNKPAINGVELRGNQTSSDLGVYSKPDDGIPSTDMTAAVQASLALADSALQSHQPLKTINNQSLIGSGNIEISGGADIFITIITGVDSSYSADKTPEQIVNSFNQGKECIAFLSVDGVRGGQMQLGSAIGDEGVYIVIFYSNTVDDIETKSPILNEVVGYYDGQDTSWSLKRSSILDAPEEGGIYGQILKKTLFGTEWSNLKTINNQNLLGSGNISVSDIFIATYNFTSFADLTNAYNAGKALFVRKTVTTGMYTYLPLEAMMGTVYVFSGGVDSLLESIRCFSDSRWTYDTTDLIVNPSSGKNGQVLKKNYNVNDGVEWANEAYPKDSLKNSFVRHNGSASLIGGVSIPASSWFITWREGDGTTGPRYLDNALIGTTQMRNINEYDGKLISTDIDYDYFYFDQFFGNQPDGSYISVAGSEHRVYSDSAKTNVIGTIIQANHPSVNMYKGWGNNENYNDFITVYPDQRCQFIPFANHSSMKYVYCANEDLEPDPESNRPIVLCFGSPYGAYDRTFSPTSSSGYDLEFYYTSRPVSLRAFLFSADLIASQ